MPDHYSKMSSEELQRLETTNDLISQLNLLETAKECLKEAQGYLNEAIEIDKENGWEDGFIALDAVSITKPTSRRLFIETQLADIQDWIDGIEYVLREE